MRNRWDHEAPEDHQPCPRDNTSRYIYAQVSRWLRTDEPIHPETAMEIAAWWHAPCVDGTSIAVFASHGDVKIHGIGGWESDAGLGPDLGDAIRAILAKSGGSMIDTQCLRALGAYVDAVEHTDTRYRRSLWHGGGHRWMSTDKTDHDSCLTCGVEARLRPDSSDGDYGSYFGGDGELIIDCTGRTDLVHGDERHCEADSGRECQDARDSDTCTHTDHVCNCTLCCN